MTKSEWPLVIFVVLLDATMLIETTSDYNHYFDLMFLGHKLI
jgi:hypothetical protein